MFIQIYKNDEEYLRSYSANEKVNKVMATALKKCTIHSSVTVHSSPQYFIFLGKIN